MRDKKIISGGFRTYLSVFLILFTLPVCSQEAKGDSEDEMAKRLLKNVVRINASFNGHLKSGFGFIVGERNSGKLLIVTCNHLVRNVAGQKVENVKVMFSGAGKWITAELLEGHEVEPRDLAVVEVLKPKDLHFVSDCMSPRYASDSMRGLKAKFIGRGDKWWIPMRNLIIHSEKPDKNSIIEIETNLVESGTSGTPLIISDGIIGMILSDSGTGIAKALSLRRIKDAFNEWGYPWTIKIIKPIPPPPPPEEDPIVYITRAGERYHKSGCWHLKGKETIALKLSEAVKLGKTPCKSCLPPPTKKK